MDRRDHPESKVWPERTNDDRQPDTPRNRLGTVGADRRQTLCEHVAEAELKARPSRGHKRG